MVSISWNRQASGAKDTLQTCGAFVSKIAGCRTASIDYWSSTNSSAIRWTNIRELSETDLYRERVQLLTSIPGIGMVAAMEILVELQDVSRFRRADRLAAYVGLTPAQFSSADKIRMGRITRVGNLEIRQNIGHSYTP